MESLLTLEKILQDNTQDPTAVLWNLNQFLRAAPRKYQLDEEIVTKSPGLKLSQNKALWALVTKSLV